jgi:hypothetical protein
MVAIPYVEVGDMVGLWERLEVAKGQIRNGGYADYHNDKCPDEATAAVTLEPLKL